MFWNLPNKYIEGVQPWAFHAKGDLKNLISLSNLLKNLASTNESIFQSKWKFSLWMFLCQGPFKAESTLFSSIIRKEQACLHPLLFCKYCHSLSCSISMAFHCKAGGMFWIVQIQVSMTSSSSLGFQKCFAMTEVSLSQTLSKSVMRDHLNSHYSTDQQRQMKYSHFCFCGRSKCWLTVF